MHRLAEVPPYDLMLVNSVFCAAPGSPSARAVPGRIVCDSGRRSRAEPFQCLLATRQAFASRGFSDDELFICNDPDDLPALLDDALSSDLELRHHRLTETALRLHTTRHRAEMLLLSPSV